jgi:hypothetical protein
VEVLSTASDRLLVTQAAMWPRDEQFAINLIDYA